jgi:translation elongation factor EF-G
MRFELMEKIAEQDDKLMEKYFAEGTLTVEEMKA